MNCNVTTGGTWQPVTKIVKRVTKTIDRYSPSGEYLGREVITEEYEDIQREVWEPQYPTYPQPDPLYGWQVTCDANSAIAIN